MQRELFNNMFEESLKCFRPFKRAAMMLMWPTVKSGGNWVSVVVCHIINELLAVWKLNGIEKKKKNLRKSSSFAPNLNNFLSAYDLLNN